MSCARDELSNALPATVSDSKQRNVSFFMAVLQIKG
jgi:hypothetical protein